MSWIMVRGMVLTVLVRENLWLLSELDFSFIVMLRVWFRLG